MSEIEFGIFVFFQIVSVCGNPKLAILDLLQFTLFWRMCALLVWSATDKTAWYVATAQGFLDMSLITKYIFMCCAGLINSTYSEKRAILESWEKDAREIN